MLALNLRYLREKYHLQRRDIAALTGVSNGTVAMWEDGYDVPGRELILQISDYFMVPEKDLKGKDLRAMSDEERIKRIAALDYVLDCIVNENQKVHFSVLQDMYYELKEEFDESTGSAAGCY